MGSSPGCLPTMSRIAFLSLPILLLCACPRVVDRYTLERVVPQAGAMGDVDRACALGASLGQVLASTSRGEAEPHLALIISETTAGFCAEGEAWEAELEAARLMFRGDDLPAVQDARIREARAHAQAAQRFLASWDHLVARYGPVGTGDCPALEGDEGIIYLLGMYAGVNALLHDHAGGGGLGVPADIVMAVARGTECVDDEQWWHSPWAMRAAAWAMVPGMAPEGVEPWAELEAAAVAGETTGVRLGRGLQVLVAANAGRDEDVAHALVAHAAANASAPAEPTWALLDEYSRLVSLHEADLMWTTARGHRCPDMGVLPDAPAQAAPSPDPFAGDDPFGAPPAPPSTPPSEPETTP
jgi:hypothetical protein